MEVIWSLSALKDLQRIRDYIALFNPSAGRGMAKEIVAKAESLINFPYRCRALRSSDLREASIVHPYIIRYRIETDRVVILRVRHSSRKPLK